MAPSVSKTIDDGVMMSLDNTVWGSTVLPFDMPVSFPKEQWMLQQQIYQSQLSWYLGYDLAEYKDSDTSGKKLYRYPLHINSLRTLVRKHASVLFGEAPDGPYPLVKPLISPVDPFDVGQPANEEEIKLARKAEAILNNIWIDSGGRMIQMENGKFCQYLGGSVFHARYMPSMINQMRLPIRIMNIRPDQFLPVWANGNDPFDLLKAYVVRRIDAQTALMQYGIKVKSPMMGGLYMEEWGRETYSITIDDQPISEEIEGAGKISYKDVEHGFGRVPFFYIPHLKEGGNYGPSHVEDVVGLLKELNARLADTGDIVFNQATRERFGKNLRSGVKFVEASGLSYYDLGSATMDGKLDPEIKTETPPLMSDSLIHYIASLYEQFRREGFMTGVMDGEDEGSQRSALTLAFRMWPITAHTRDERTSWNEGLSRLNRFILEMLINKQKENSVIRQRLGAPLPDDLLLRVQVSQDWAPQIPRDLEQAVNTEVILHQEGLRSTLTSIEKLGDVRNPQEEIDRIKEEKEFEAEMAMKAKPAQQEGAPTKKEEPVATTGLNE
jgi:hypothetical protein